MAYGVWVGRVIRGPCRGRRTADQRQQGLHAEPVAAVGLQDLQAGVVVEHLPGQGEGDVLADVVVADAPGVGIAVRPLPHLGRGPRPHPGEAPQGPVGGGVRAESVRSSAAARTAVRTRVRLRRCSTPAARKRQLGTRAQASGVGGTNIPYAAEPGSRVGPGAGSPNSRTSSRQARNASWPVTTCSMQAGASASKTASVRPTRKWPQRRWASTSTGCSGRGAKPPGVVVLADQPGQLVEHPLRARRPRRGPTTSHPWMTTLSRAGPVGVRVARR